MSYQVLARKWRPRFFREMVGQEHVLQALINALDHDRLHHAYLFTGTRGVGKTTIARILAKCLNCETGVSSEPCGQCSACQEINDGCFVDLIEVDAASNTGVDDVREIIDNAQYRPSKGRYKVYLIDEVHMLSKNAFNALLKTLEEPPEHVKFLLATTDPQKLPATILSRCLQFYLKNMSPERIVEHLSHVLKQEMINFEEPALWALARSANGSMRDAMSLTDQAIAFGSGKVVEAEVRAMLGSIDQQTVYSLAEALCAHQPARLLDIIKEFSEQAPDYAGVMDELLSLLHRMTIAQLVPDGVDNSLGDKDKVIQLAQLVTAEELQLFYQMGLMGKRDLPLAPDMRTGLEMAVLRMLAFRPEGLAEPPVKSLPQEAIQTASEHEAEIVKKPEATVQIPEALSSGDVAVAVAQKPEVSMPDKPEQVEQGNPDLSALFDQKRTVEDSELSEPGCQVKETEKATNDEVLVDQVTNQLSLSDISDHEGWLKNFRGIPFSGLLKSVAAECVLLSCAGKRLHLGLDKSSAQLFNDKHVQQIQDVLSSATGVNIEVTLEDSTQGLKKPSEYLAELKRAAYDKALDSLNNNSGVRAILDNYDAEIIPESVKSRIEV